MSLSEFLKDYLNPKSMTFITVEILILILFALILSFLSSKVLNIVEKRSKTTETSWDDVLVSSLRWPLQILIYTFFTIMILEISNSELKSEIIKGLVKVKPVVFVVTLFLFLMSMISGMEDIWVKKHNTKKTKIDLSVIDIVAKVSRIVVIVILALIGLDAVGFNISGFVAFGSVSAAVIGFASKDMLSNILGALTLYLDAPFKVGELIKLPEKGVEGVIEKIGTRNTTLRTPEKRVLIVPNSMFSQVMIENISRMTHRRIQETISLRYSDLPELDNISKDIETYLKKHKSIDSDQSLFAVFNNFTPNSVDLLINAYLKVTEFNSFYREKHFIMLQIGEILKKHKVKIANFNLNIQVK